MLHLYSAFLDTQSALHSNEGIYPHPPPVCSIHLDDATAAILHQNTHHTPAYCGEETWVMKPISVWGWLGGLDGQRPVGKFGQNAGVIPLLFFEGHPGIFNDHRESGPQINILSYSTVSPSLYLGVRPTHTTGWAPPAGLINTSSCSNLVYFSISIYAFSRCFYPKRLTIAFRLYIFISMSVPWESNPQPFALLTHWLYHWATQEHRPRRF